jgi:PAS domain S-box-containing protein
MSTPYFDQSLLPLQHEPDEAIALLGDLLAACADYSIVATDVHGRIVVWSPGASRMYGCRPDEALGRPSTEILQLGADVSQMYKAALRNGVLENTAECVRPSGERFTARLVVSVRRNAATEPVGLIFVSYDISSQVRLTTEVRTAQLNGLDLEEQVRRKNRDLEEQRRRARESMRAKNDFLANMSHELRTPLNAIIGFSELLFDGKVGALDATHQQYVGHILTSSRHLLQLINDILDLAKVEAGQMMFAADPLDLDRLARQVRDVLRSMAARKRLQVTIDVDPRVGQVIADAARLKQVLYNYLSNAIKFTPEGGRIVVRIQPAGDDMFRLSVEDSGIGVRPEDLGRLFVEFQQLDASMAKLYQGTGLGLAVTRRIVEAQGGVVEVQSTPGRGSTFSAILPRQLSTANVPAPVSPEPTPGSGPAILVVEDEPADRAFLQGTFSQEGYVVHTAATLADALALAQERQFSAITLDLVLPDGQGLDLVRSIRAGGPNVATPVLVVSILPDEDIAAGFPVHGFVSKPVQSDILIQEVGRLGSGATVLVLGDESPNVETIAEHLRERGYRPICAADAHTSPIRASESPRAVVVDPSMLSPRAAGRLGHPAPHPGAQRTPILAWAGNGMPAAEQAQLDLSLRTVVLSPPD